MMVLCKHNEQYNNIKHAIVYSFDLNTYWFNGIFLIVFSGVARKGFMCNLSFLLYVLMYKINKCVIVYNIKHIFLNSIKYYKKI